MTSLLATRVHSKGRKFLHRTGVVLSILGLAGFIGCTSNSLSGSSYSRSDARKGYAVESGEIVAVKEIYIHGEATSLGRVSGAAVGYAIGRDVGSGSYVPRAVGGVVGGVAGGAVEETVTGEHGLELTVALDNGRGTILVVQDDDVHFTPGDRVRILRGNGQVRVQR
jgi:outer membrane lipoprotein SlyB